MKAKYILYPLLSIISLFIVTNQAKAAPATIDCTYTRTDGQNFTIKYVDGKLTIPKKIGNRDVHATMDAKNFTTSTGTLSCPTMWYYDYFSANKHFDVDISTIKIDKLGAVAVNGTASNVNQPDDSKPLQSCSYGAGKDKMILSWSEAGLSASFEGKYTNFDKDIKGFTSPMFDGKCPDPIYTLCIDKQGMKICRIRAQTDDSMYRAVRYNSDDPIYDSGDLDDVNNALTKDRFTTLRADVDAAVAKVQNCLGIECDTLNQDRAELRAALNKLKKFCNYVYASTGEDYLTPDELLALKTDCQKFEQDYQSWVESGLISDYKEGCGIFNEEMKEKIRLYLNIVKIGGPLLAIVLGMLDFLKAVVSQENDANKKAFKHFLYRMIAAAVLLLVPIILEFAMNVVSPDKTSENPFCVETK